MAVKGGGSGGGGGSRARSYGLLLMLTFGAAILGVMILHKLRERRIFNLLVREKDHQLISLQLLLQKEKDIGKDAKRQIEELKAKMHRLRAKKTDLETRIQEMDSTISSLREEQRTIALTLEEKQKEIKRGEKSQETARFMALSEALQKKAAEIEELKRRVELPVKVWSVSSDDPSNLTAKNSSGENGSSTSAEISQDKMMQDGKNETNEEQHHKQENSSDVDQLQGNGTVNSDHGRRIWGKRRRRMSDKTSKRSFTQSMAGSNESADGMEQSHKVYNAKTANKKMETKVTNSGSNLQNVPANSTFVEDSKLFNKTNTSNTEKEIKEDDLKVDDDQETESFTKMTFGAEVDYNEF